MTLNSDYESEILRQAIARELEKKRIPAGKEGVAFLEDNRDELVWEIASAIYRQSGKTVEFYVVSLVLSDRISSLEKNLAEAEMKKQQEKIKKQQEIAEAEARKELTKDEITGRIREIIAESEELEEEEI